MHYEAILHMTLSILCSSSDVSDADTHAAAAAAADDDDGDDDDDPCVTIRRSMSQADDDFTSVLWLRKVISCQCKSSMLIPFVHIQ